MLSVKYFYKIKLSNTHFKDSFHRLFGYVLDFSVYFLFKMDERAVMFSLKYFANSEYIFNSYYLMNFHYWVLIFLFMLI